MPAYVGDGSSWASKPAHKRDFQWSKSTEPHKPRNQMILAEFPQIKKLFGHDPMTKYKIVFAVTLQVSFILRYISILCQSVPPTVASKIFHYAGCLHLSCCVLFLTVNDCSQVAPTVPVKVQKALEGAIDALSFILPC